MERERESQRECARKQGEKQRGRSLYDVAGSYNPMRAPHFGGIIASRNSCAARARVMFLIAHFLEVIRCGLPPGQITPSSNNASTKMGLQSGFTILVIHPVSLTVWTWIVAQAATRHVCRIFSINSTGHSLMLDKDPHTISIVPRLHARAPCSDSTMSTLRPYQGSTPFGFARSLDS